MPEQRKLVFLFSGQGSHYYQMGRDLFEQRGSFHRHAVEVDSLFREALGTSVLKIIYDPRRKISDPFDRTVLTHAAIFLVEYALAKALIDDGLRPDYALATSMGAFAALVLAESLSVEQAILALITQARLLDVHCVAGGMLALAGVERQRVEAFARRFDCELASVNPWTTCVLAGDQARLAGAETVLRNENIGYQRLAVSRAFHSRWIDAAATPYRTFLASLHLRPPHIPIVCCAESGILREIPAAYLWDVVRKPIRFDDTVNTLCRAEPMLLVDVGPSGTLATSLKYLPPHSVADYQVQAVLSPFGGGAARYEWVLAKSRSS
ncbi:MULTISPECIES: acyltransferase domain-containing protein [Paraburkholderia]|uniref:acyltransferase domain-containing protein n=1 Tax=Paraburkholderia TaxID=1822464 RepID=UPI00225A2A35|nr:MULTISPECIES: acyltransferase domain-containing protein [Paraburkholderia]MCX4163672.1 acyltransferase domain-containing protein [Paraburkholderia megapolitana]MDN7159167.1 acyltransferase domain-containing protein [Paraburkholderia sp. CHISQ3]MDQ6496214.1 acyltransferase domain-containing protein [Paraburkholderia megapolitana]